MKRLFTNELNLESFKKDRFNIMRSFPSTHMIVVHITKADIKINPALGVRNPDLYDYEKAGLYKMLVGIDNVRMLGKDIALYLGITPKENYLCYMMVDGKNSDRKTRRLFCQSFGFSDAVLQYGVTGEELLKMYTVLPDVPLVAKRPDKDELFAFNLEDLYNVRHKERTGDDYDLDKMLFGNIVEEFLDYLERI